MPTFCLAARTVSFNDPAELAQPSSSMSLISSRCSRGLSLLTPSLNVKSLSRFNKGTPTSLFEAFLKEDLDLKDLERIVGREVAAVHT